MSKNRIMSLLIALVAASFAAAAADPVVSDLRMKSRTDDVLELVDPFVGTGGSGHTTPAAAYPFGMVQPGPDTGHEGWERCSAYQYGDACAARFAAALGGREADAKFFLGRSRAWTNCFDAATS